MDWYGREPDAGHEVGVYSDTIPAAGGAKSDVRWPRLTRKDGYGLLIRQESTLFHLITRRERPEGPVMLSIDLSHEPVPFKSWNFRSEEHTPELQSLMRSSYAVFCLKKKTKMYSTLMI